MLFYNSAQADSLEITLEKYDTGTAVFRYATGFSAEKSGAVSCEITTPRGTFNCIDMGDGLELGQDFHDNHSNLTFAELNAAILSNWTLTWDKGLATIGNHCITNLFIKKQQRYPRHRI